MSKFLFPVLPNWQSWRVERASQEKVITVVSTSLRPDLHIMALKIEAYLEPECGLRQLVVWVINGARVPSMLGNAFIEIYHLGSTHLAKDGGKDNISRVLRIQLKLMNLHHPSAWLVVEEKAGVNRLNLLQKLTVYWWSNSQCWKGKDRWHILVKK